MAFRDQVMLALNQGQVCISGRKECGEGVWRTWWKVGGEVTYDRAIKFIDTIFYQEVLDEEKIIIHKYVTKWLTNKK